MWTRLMTKLHNNTMLTTNCHQSRIHRHVGDIFWWLSKIKSQCFPSGSNSRSLGCQQENLQTNNWWQIFDINKTIKILSPTYVTKYSRIFEVFQKFVWFLKCPILRRQMNRYTLLEFFEKIRFWLFEFCLFHAFLFLDFKIFSE